MPPLLFQENPDPPTCWKQNSCLTPIPDKPSYPFTDHHSSVVGVGRLNVGKNGGARNPEIVDTTDFAILVNNNQGVGGPRQT